MSGLPYGGGGALGIVIVSRQRTSRDGEATLKFNCGQDDLVKRLVDRCNTLSTQYLHTIYTLFTHYLHTIYTLSTHYLHTIYTLSTHYLQAVYPLTAEDITGEDEGAPHIVRAH